MNTEYVIKLVLKARDEASAALARVRAELEALDNHNGGGLNGIGQSAQVATQRIQEVTKAVQEHTSAQKDSTQATDRAAESQKKAADASRKLEEKIALTRRAYSGFRDEVKKGTLAVEEQRSGFRRFASDFDSISRRFQAGSDSQLRFGRMAEQARGQFQRLGSDATKAAAAAANASKAQEKAATDAARAQDKAAAEVSRARARAESEAHKAELTARALASKTEEVRQETTRFNHELDQGVHSSESARSGIRRLISENDGLARKFGASSNEAREFGLEAERLRGRLADLGRETSSSGSYLERWQRSVENSHLNVARLDNNLRGLMVLGIATFAQQLLSAFTALGGSLVSVASSAVAAGAAIGGALTAGVAQAIPAVGLLAAAIHRVSAVGDALKQADLVAQQQYGQHEKMANRAATATDALANAQDGLRAAQQRVVQSHQRVKDALQGVNDAEYNGVQAQEKLTDARRDAARQLQDLINAEREAKLAAEGAALSQEEAQERLAQAVSSGDTAAIARDRLDVQQAALDAQEARQRASRATSDNTRGQRGGVEGADSVRQARRAVEESARGIQQARRQVRDARQDVADAQEGVAKAQRAISNAARQQENSAADSMASVGKLNYLLNKELDGSERRLYRSVKTFEDVYKKATRPITDIIVDSFSRTVTKAEKVIKDPRLTGALTFLAHGMSSGMDRIVSSLTSDRTIGRFAGITREAARNMKPLSDAAIAVSDAFLNIAEHGQGTLRWIVNGVKGWAENFDRITSDSRRMDGLFSTFQDHLKAWKDLAGATLSLLFAIGGKAAPEGKTAVEDLTDQVKKATDWIEANGEKTSKFFEDARKAAEAVATVLWQLAKVVVQVFDPKGVQAFASFLNQVAIPALRDVVHLFGTMTRIILEVGSNKYIAPLAKIALELGLIIKTLNTINKLALSGKIAVMGKEATAGSGAVLGLKGNVMALNDVLKGGTVYARGLGAAFLALGRTRSISAAADAFKGVQKQAKIATAEVEAMTVAEREAALVARETAVMPGRGAVPTLVRSPGGVALPAGSQAAREAEQAAAAGGPGKFAGAKAAYGMYAGFQLIDALSTGKNVSQTIHSLSPTAILGDKDPLRADGPLARYSGGKGWGNAASDIYGFGKRQMLAPVNMARDLYHGDILGAAGNAARLIPGGRNVFNAGQDLYHGQFGKALLDATPLGGLFGHKSEQDKSQDALRKSLESFQKDASKDGVRKLVSAADIDGLEKLEKRAHALAEEFPKGAKQLNAFADQARAAADKVRPLRVALDDLKVRGIRGIDKDDIIDPNAVSQFTGELHKMRTYGITSITDLRSSMRFNIKEINAGFQEGSAGWAQAMSKNTTEGVRALKAAMTDGRVSVAAGTKEIARLAEANGKSMRDSMADRSLEGRQAMGQNFTDAASAIDDQMHRAGRVTESGMKRVQDLMIKGLKLYGFTSEQAENIAKTGNLNGAATGTGNEGGGGREYGSSPSGGSWNPGGHAVGGRVYGPGTDISDSVPVRLSSGEHVLTAAEVRAAGGHGAIFAMRRMLGGGGQGGSGRYAKGGYVQGAIAPGHKATSDFAQRLFSKGFNVTSAHDGRHAPNGYHYRGGGEALDFGDSVNDLRALWKLLQPMSGLFPELFGPRYLSPKPTLMHFGSGFSDEGLQAQHDDHIHVAVVDAVRQHLGEQVNAKGGQGGDGGSSTPEVAAKVISGVRTAMKGAQGAIAQRIVDGAVKAANRRLEQGAGLAGGDSGDGDLSNFSGGGDSAANIKLGQKMARAMGWTGRQWSALKQLWTRESGWNQHADNPTSDAYGIPQALPGNKMASAGRGWHDDPATQIRWGLRYIKGRYGSPANAWAHEVSAGWYARGGEVPGHGDRDTVPAMLTPGEHVWTKREVEAFGGHGAIMALRRALGGGTQAHGAAYARGGQVYPLAAKGSIIGTPYKGTHTLGNWQSDNAVDIGIPVGTNVRSIAEAVVRKIRVHANDGGRFAGTQVTIGGSWGEAFYTHLRSHAVKLGQKLGLGQYIGDSGSANGVAHLHFGVKPPLSPYTYVHAALAAGAAADAVAKTAMKGKAAAPIADPESFSAAQRYLSDALGVIAGKAPAKVASDTGENAGSVQRFNHAYPHHKGFANLSKYARFTAKQVRAVASYVGLPPSMFQKIAHGESGYYPGIWNQDPGGTHGYGMWAITPDSWGSHSSPIYKKFQSLGGVDAMFNPILNGRMAKWMYDHAASKTPNTRGFPWYGTRYLATGGHVDGPGTATSDSIPAMLSRGEHVWSAAEVARAGGHQVMYALRRALGGGRQGGPGYATGGAAVPVWAGVDRAIEQQRFEIALAKLKGDNNKQEREAERKRHAERLDQIKDEEKLQLKGYDGLSSTQKRLVDQVHGLYTQGTVRPTTVAGVQGEIRKDIFAQDVMNAGSGRKLVNAADVVQIRNMGALTNEGGLLDQLRTAIETRVSKLATNLQLATYKITRKGVVIDDSTKPLTDAAENLTKEYHDLVGERGAINKGLTRVNARLARLKRGGISKDEEKEYENLSGVRTSLLNRRDANRTAVGQNLQSRYDAQLAITQRAVDDASAQAARRAGVTDRAARISTALGITGPAADQTFQKVGAAQEQINALRDAAKRASNHGQTALKKQIDDQIADLQTTITEIVVGQFHDQIAEADKLASARTAAIDIRGRVATALGRVGDAAKVSADRMAEIKREISDKQAMLARAQELGDKGSIETLTGQIADLTATGIETAAQAIQDGIDQVNQAAQRQLNAADLANRMLDATGSVSWMVPGGRSGIFAAKGAAMQNQLAGLQNSYNEASAQGNQGIMQSLADQMAELRVAIQENTRAEFMARVDDVNNRANYLNTINGLNAQIVQLTGDISGVVDSAKLIQLATEKQTTLQDQRAGLTGLLAEATSNHDQQAINDLNQQLLENQVAILENTKSLKELDGTLGGNVQSFTTSAWQQFRQAIFNGSGGLLPQYDIPAMDVGGYVKKDGYAYLHAAEVVLNKGQADSYSNPPDFKIEIDHPMEEADAVLIGNRIAWELSGMGRR